MGAAQQVFDVNELLEIIICQVEVHQIPELKLVDKSWCGMTKTSKAIHRARVCPSLGSYDPFEGEDLGAMTAAQFESAMEDAYLENDIATSAFSSLSWIRVNPVLDEVWTRKAASDRGIQYCEVTIRLPPTSAALHTVADQYVTEPPCRSLTVERLLWEKAAWCVPEYPNFCWAENPKGLKIKDILAILDQISAMDPILTAEEGPEIAVTFIVEGTSAGEGTPEDHALSCAYFDGPLPRFGKASHKLGREGVDASLSQG